MKVLFVAVSLLLLGAVFSINAPKHHNVIVGQDSTDDDFVGDNYSNLKALLAKIQSTNKIDASTVGTTISGQLNIAIDSGSLTVAVINSTLTQTTLTINVNTQIWNTTVYAHLVFGYDSQNNLQLELTFTASNINFALLYNRILERQPPPYLLDLSGNAAIEIQLSTITGQMTLGATVNILSGTLLQAVRFLQPSASNVQVTANLLIPIFSSSPANTKLSLAESGAFNIGTSIHVEDFSIVVTPNSVALTADFGITTGSGATTQTWQFDLQGDWDGTSDSVSFEGSLTTSSPVSPLNIAWLSLTKLTATFDVTLPSTGAPKYDLTISAIASVSWASSTNPPLTAVLTLGGTGADLSQLLIEIKNIPISVLTGFYSTVVNAPFPAILQQTSVKGSANIAISTYTSGSVKEGLTLNVPVQVQTVSGPNGSTLLDAVRVLLPSATSTTFNFDFSLFSPIFGPQPASDVDLSLSEQGTFKLTPGGELLCLDFQIIIDISGSSSSIQIDADVAVEISNGQLEFAVSADWQEQAQTTFTGSLIGSWTHPFGLKWLTINSLSLSLVLGSGSSPAGITLTGAAVVDFAPSEPFTFTISLTSSSGSGIYDQVLFAITGIPLSTFDEFYDTVVGSTSTPPAVLKQTIIKGSANLYISTYNASPSIKPGVTLDVPVVVTTISGPQGNLLLEAIQLLDPKANTGTFDFDFFIYVPVFSSAPYLVDMQLQELSSFPLSDSGKILCDGFDLNLQAAESGVTLDIDVDVSIFIKSQATPLNFSLVADFQGLVSTTFSGSLTSPWDQPFGLKWLTIPTAQLSLVIGGGDVASLTLQGTGDLTFAPKPVTIVLEISSSGTGLFDQLLFEVTNIPISEMNDMFKAVTGSAMPSVLDSVTLVQGTISFTIATYNAGVAQEGFTFSADVTVSKTSGDNTLYNAAALMNSDPSSQEYLFQLYLPIFGPQVGFSVSLTENGGFSISKSIEVNGYAIAVSDSGSDVSVSLSAQLSVSLAEQKGPLFFSVSADFSSGSESASFSGSMTGPWVDPFGAKWLTIDSASIDFTISAVSIGSFSISASGAVVFKDVSANAQFAFSTDSTFTQVSMTCTVQSLWTLAQIGTDVMDLGNDAVKTLNELSTEANVDFEIILSTYSYGSVLAGLTIGANGKVTGDLLKTLEAMYKDLNDVTFSIDLVLPIFAESSTFEIALTFADQIQITTNVWFESMGFSLAVSDAALAISADATILTHWKRNPPLTFHAGGSFSTDGTVLLSGYLLGTWEHPFGCKGFNLSEVILEVGFDPAMCVVDACISDFGVGYTMEWGQSVIQFDGNAAAPDFENVFLYGSISGANNMAVTVLEVAQEWNKIAWPHVDTTLIPADWGLTDTAFYFAPVDGTFGPITYTAGFAFTSGFVLLDMALTLSINCTEAVGDACDFSFNVNLNLQLFKEMIQKELGLLGKGIDIFSINSLSLTEWSQKGVANGVDPRWQMEITVFDNPNNLDFRVKQYEMAHSFHDFFDQWLAHIFG